MLPRDINEFEALLPEPFCDKGLIEQAFIHRSFLNEIEEPGTLEDNERLEFLGDSVLGFVVSELIYLDYPEYKEGQLTEIRSRLVRQDSLARFAAELQMGDFLRLGRGEETSDGRNRPATLCATFEAVVGAVYLDRGIEAVVNLLHPIILGELQPSEETDWAKDPKSRLQELVQATVGQAPRYQQVQRDGPDHASTFTMVVKILKVPTGVGRGPSKQIASQHAAAMTLHRLGKPAPEYQSEPELEQRYPLEEMELDDFVDLADSGK